MQLSSIAGYLRTFVRRCSRKQWPMDATVFSAFIVEPRYGAARTRPCKTALTSPSLSPMYGICCKVLTSSVSDGSTCKERPRTCSTG